MAYILGHPVKMTRYVGWHVKPYVTH